MSVIENHLHIPEEFIIFETKHWVLNHSFASACRGI